MKSSGERVLDQDERSWWDSWNGQYRANDRADPTASELFDRVKQTVHTVAKAGDARILEIGCGSGHLSRQLRWSSYHGIDISPAAIEIARRSAHQIPNGGAATFEAADFHDWTIPPDAFDLVVCVDAIAYFRDQSLAVRKMAEALRPSGRLVLTTINPVVYARIARTNTHPIREGPVSRWLSRGELHTLLGSNGFVIERSCSVMPRGDLGFLRVVNSRKLNRLLGMRIEARLRPLKESAGLGQYRLVVARKQEQS